MVPGSVRPGTPTPPPTTPFQPGASPSPPIQPLLALGALGALGLNALWDWLNQRPPSTGGEPSWEESLDEDVMFPADTWIWLRWTTAITSTTTDCTTGYTESNSSPGSGGVWGYGRGLRVAGVMSKSISKGCDGVAGVSGPLARYEVLNANGTVNQTVEMFAGGASIGNGASGSVAISVSPSPQLWPSYEVIPAPSGGSAPGTFAPGMAPQLPGTAPAPEPLTAPPLPLPLPLPLPAAVPSALPAPRPASAPGGAPARAPGSAPGGAPAPAPAPAPAVVPRPLPLVPLGPAGPIAPPVTAPPAVTPADGVVLDGQLQGGPGLAPAPTMQAMAAELGRLERKGEITIDKLGRMEALAGAGEVLQALAEWLLSADPGTTYSIQPPCGTDANGDPLPPVDVIVPPTIGPDAALLARVDALAMLIDEHKQIRQPICKGKPTGQPVTVTFVEADP